MSIIYQRYILKTSKRDSSDLFKIIEKNCIRISKKIKNFYIENPLEISVAKGIHIAKEVHKENYLILELQ